MVTSRAGGKCSRFCCPWFGGEGKVASEKRKESNVGNEGPVEVQGDRDDYCPQRWM